MATYLFSWDPTKWDWRNIKEQADQVARGVPVVKQWSCGSNRRIFNGDVAYFIRQGREPRGLFARAEVVRGSYEASNVDVQDANRGRNTLVVDVRFTHLIDAVNKVVVPRQALKDDPFGKMMWDIKASGAKLPEPVAALLEQAWQKPESSSRTKKPASTPTNTAAPQAEAAVPTRDEAGEQERLRAEREARQLHTRSCEPGGRKDQAAAMPATPEVEQTSPERRNEVLVQNYFILLDAQLQGDLYSKADHRNRILKDLGTSDAATIDRDHRRISAVLAETGLPFAEGFPPEGGFDDALEKAVHVFIEANPELIEGLWIDELPRPASIPVELDDSRAHWVPPPESSGYRPSARLAWHPAGINEIDFRVREARNRNLATAGERFVLAFERARLRETGRKDQQERIVWQSQTFGDSFGYDISSLEEGGEERQICVKTTNYNSRFPFVLTQRELERARENPDHFYVYRVFDFSRSVRLYMLSGSQLLSHTLEPVGFRAWV